MRRVVWTVLTLTLLAGAMPLLSACNTTAGAGQDISNTGTAIKKAADRNM